MIDRPVHPIFSSFPRWKGEVPHGYTIDFLGVKTDMSFLTHTPEDFPGGFWDAQYPEPNEGFFEYIDVLEAAYYAGDEFRMIDLGAGYGRWLIEGYTAYRRYHSGQVLLAGIEGDATHYQFMIKMFRDNGITPEEHWLLHLAVSDRGGVLGPFQKVDPVLGYGQYLMEGKSQDYQTVVTVKLSEILAMMGGRVDLIDMDIQGMEARVIREALSSIDREVKRIHIGTHNKQVEEEIRTMMKSVHWTCNADYSLLGVYDTTWGPAPFQDGVQSWTNPKLVRL